MALVFFVPLSDLSVLLSLFPSFRFPGWQWVLIALAAPVAGWAAWPFHPAALKNARHGVASMDTLVSLGIIAACGWSVYAMFVLDRGAGPGQRAAAADARLRRRDLPGGRGVGDRRSCWPGGGMRPGPAATPATRCGSWPRPGRGTACVLDADGTERRVPVGQLRPGDRFVVRPGEVIAADGVVEFGESAVDTSMMTGESVPAEVAEGGAVTAGTVVVSGRLIVRAAGPARTPSWRT